MHYQSLAGALLSGLALVGQTIASPHYKRTESATTTLGSGTVPISSSVPTATLLPAVHWDQDVTELHHLQPKNHAKLFYSENGLGHPDFQTHIASMLLNFTHPAITLEHSAHIQSVRCGADNMTVKFNSKAAYNLALQNWVSDEPIILVSYFPGCGDFENKERSYFLAGKLTPTPGQLRTVTLAVRSVPMEHVMTHMDVEWGAYIPDKNATIVHKRAAKIDIPSETLGPNFDKELDQKLGTINLDDDGGNPAEFKSDLQSIAPGLGDYNVKDYNSLNRRASAVRRLSKRWPAWLDKVAAKVVDTVKQNIAVVQKVAQTVVSVVNTGLQVVGGVAKLVTGGTVTPEYTTSYDIIVPKPGTVQYMPSIFSANSFLLYEYETKQKDLFQAKIFCVDCGVKGKVVVGGRLAYSFADGLTRGQVYLNGDLTMTLQVGIEANLKYEKTFKKRIVEVPLQPYVIPNVLDIGPAITLDAEAVFTIEATGSLLAGVIVSLPAPQATIDFIDSKNTGATGWTPQVQPIFKANAEVTVGADIEFPVGLGVGISILGGKFEKRIALIDRPSLKAQIQAAVALDTKGGGFTAVGNCKSGQIEAKLDFVNKLFVDLVGAKTIDLLTNTVPIAQTCITVGKVSKRGAEMIDIIDYIYNRSQNLEEKRAVTKTVLALDATDTSTPSPTSSDEPIATSASPTSSEASTTDVVSTSSAPTPTTSTTEPSSTSEPTTSPVVHSSSTSHTATSHSSSSSSPSSATIVDVPSATFADDYKFPSATAKFNAPDAQFFTYGLISNKAKDVIVTQSMDGNLYLEKFTTKNEMTNDNGKTFTLIKDIVVADEAARVLHYYKPTMQQYGVSRFRLSALEAMPESSKIVTLVAVTGDISGEQSGLLVAADTMEGTFYIATCTFVNNLTKLFLVKDPVKGLETLKRVDLRNTITGGAVTECYHIAYTVIDQGN